MKGRGNQAGVAPGVFLVNLSVCDSRRPFSLLMSPLARLIDHLAEEYGILFLVSAGNVSSELPISRFGTWTEFEQAAPADRQLAVLEAMNFSKFERSVLSPAESLNGLTIGAQHTDNVTPRVLGAFALDPFVDDNLPNPSSALGLGYRRGVKPDLLFPGGREQIRMVATGGQLRVVPSAGRTGLRAAAPAAAGRLDAEALCAGTSAATALATRAAHQIFDALQDADGGSSLSDLPLEYSGVVVKALLVHRSRWSAVNSTLLDVCGPAEKRRYIERAENVTRFVGLGVPRPEESFECSGNRATLVGFGRLAPDAAHRFRVPLPDCLRGVTIPRKLVVTLSWFSPIRPGHHSYRGVRLGVSTKDPLASLGVERGPAQPAGVSVAKGTVFHECFEGDQATPYIDEGYLTLDVWCRDDAGVFPAGVRYGLAVTIESESEVPIYDEVRVRLGVKVQRRA